MQIEVVDDCSHHNEAESIVKEVCPDRIIFFRQPHRKGLVSNWNACIERAHGHFVHILHDDDFVANGYYEEVRKLAHDYPELGLYATRSFEVDEASVLIGVSARRPELELPKQSAAPFFYANPFLFPGVTVRRISYEMLGGFRPDLGFVADWEMWARINDCRGAIISRNVFAFYRFHTEHATREYCRTAEGGRDILQLYEIFAQRYSEFSLATAKYRAAEAAWWQYNKFKSSGDELAAKANWQLWVELVSLRQRTVRQFKAAVMPIIHRLAHGSHT
jgi:glycosyltransferase involved in cell wall biosynthesis